MFELVRLRGKIYFTKYMLCSGKKSNNLLGKNLQKEAKKNKSVLQKCKKNILFELLLFLSLPS